MSGFEYIPKVGQIIITTLATAGTWYQILTEDQAKSIRGLKVKSRYTYGQQSGLPFDYAFSAVPGNDYISNTGSGFGDTFAPTSGLWARGAVNNTVIEVLVYD